MPNVEATSGLLLLFVASGVLGILEVRFGLKLPPKGARRWFLAAFALDGVVTMIAYWVLHVSLVPTFWGDPYSVYLLALFWGPILLRVKVELLVPLGKRGDRTLHLLSSVRSRLIDRIGQETSRYYAGWLEAKVVPVLVGLKWEQLFAIATSYFRGLALTDDKQTEVARQMAGVDAIKVADPPLAARSLAWLLIDNKGLSLLRQFVSE